MSAKTKKKLLVLSASVEGPEPGIPGNEEFDNKDWVPVDLVADPAQWGEVEHPSITLHALFVNHFNTDIKGGTGWTAGYLDETVIPYGTSLDDIEYDTGSYLVSGNVKPLNPNQGNIIGWTHTDPTYGLFPGYYQGSEITHDFEIYRIVVITNGTQYFLIKVTAQNVSSYNDEFAYWRSEIDFQYKVVSDTFSVAWDNNNPKHQLLKRRMKIK